MGISLLAAGAGLCTVGLSSTALLFIWQMVAHIDVDSGYLAAFGGGIIVVGGLLTTINTLGLALGNEIVIIMPLNLFSFLTPGFICVAYAVWCAQRVMRADSRPTSVWIGPMLLIVLIQVTVGVVVGLPGAPNQFVLLLATTTIANVVFNGLCIRQALWQRLRLVPLMWVGYLGAVLGLNGLGNMLTQSTERTVAIQVLNIVAAALFMAAAWQLRRATRRLLVYKNAGLAGHYVSKI